MPRTEIQNKEIREKTKAKIIDCSSELFANKGFYGTTMNDIAKMAGVSKGLAYSYFESKQKILENIIEKMFLDIIVFLEYQLNEIEKMEGKEEKLTFFIDSSMEYYNKNEYLLKIYLRIFLQDQKIITHFTNLFGNFQVKLIELRNSYSIFFKSLGSEEPETEYDYFTSFFTGIFIEHLGHGDEFPVEKIKTLLVKRFFGR